MSLLGLFRLSFQFEDMLALSAVAAALLVLVVVWQGLVVRDPLAARVKMLSERREALKAGRLVMRGHRARSDLRQSGLSFMRQTVARFNLMRGRQTERITNHLARAGWRSRDALIVYIFAKAVLPLVCGGGVILWLSLGQSQTYSPTTRLLVLCAAFGAGLYGPELFVKNMIDKRAKKMRKSMPDALDLMVICAEAGLSLDASMTRVGREMVNAAPELADEFALTALELGFLPERRDALQNLLKRTDMGELRSLINSLQQTERYGTPLAQALRVLAAEFRDERMLRAEEKAARLPALMTVPMIVFILPCLFIVLGGPAALRMMDAFRAL
ncbi:MAG: type II secretion system F family protein [Gammaproteobacteria bacterium]|nr:type II secretion system F family protein [Gammaproteobacteria bacterium]